MHVDELGSQIEVALQIRGVNDIDDDVRGLLHQLLADIQLFRAVGGEAVCAGEVDEFEVVTLIIGIAGLGIHGYTGVVAYTLMRPGCIVEK